MRKIHFLFSLMLMAAMGASAAETLTLTDGNTLSGEIVKFDDNGLMLHLPGDTYASTNIAWSHLSQDSIKHLVANPKIKPLAEVFIEPDPSQRPVKAEIKINPVENRLERPANPSLFGGLVGSPLGLFILFALYVANLFAAYEIAIFRSRRAGQVIGLSAVLPVIGPIIFLAMPMKVEAVAEVEKLVHTPAGTAAAAAQRTPEEIQIVEASWQKEEKKTEPQIFARGKFTFNKRFVETKFAGYFGAPKGDAVNFSMEVKTAKAQFAVAHILQVTMTEATFETVPPGQTTVPLADISEVKLIPKTA